jgi:hypothetical protein
MRIDRFWLGLLVGAAGALVLSGSAPAALTLTIGAAPSLSLTLTGADQAPSYAVGLTVANTGSGNGSGWNLTITSTQFTAGSHTLSTGASTISGISVGTCGGGGCNQPSNAISYPVALPAGSPAPSAVKFFNAAAGSGKGTVTLTPTVQVTVPGNSYAGTYTSVLTISLASGP